MTDTRYNQWLEWYGKRYNPDFCFDHPETWRWKSEDGDFVYTEKYTGWKTEEPHDVTKYIVPFP